MESIKVNPIKSEVSSERKTQVTELTGDEFLNDEELEAVCGGTPTPTPDISISLNPIDLFKGAYKAGEYFGKAASGRLWNDDRYC